MKQILVVLQTRFIFLKENIFFILNVFFILWDSHHILIHIMRRNHKYNLLLLLYHLFNTFRGPWTGFCVNIKVTLVLKTLWPCTFISRLLLTCDERESVSLCYILTGVLIYGFCRSLHFFLHWLNYIKKNFVTFILTVLAGKPDLISNARKIILQIFEFVYLKGICSQSTTCTVYNLQPTGHSAILTPFKC